METNTVEVMLDTAAQQAPAQPQPQPQQAPETTPEQEMQLKLRAQELITQARTIQAVVNVDVLNVYNTDVDVRSRILSGQMDFIDVWRQMKPAATPPAPMHSANGSVGTVNIGAMNDDQFARLNEMLSRGAKVDMRY